LQIRCANYSTKAVRLFKTSARETQNFIELLPSIGTEGSKVGAAIRPVFGKRPLEGPRTFLKKREIRRRPKVSMPI